MLENQNPHDQYREPLYLKEDFPLKDAAGISLKSWAFGRQVNPKVADLSA